jgi:hypothetical protein
MRSKLAAFKTITKVDCDTDWFSLARHWTVIDNSTNQTVDISNNPTINTAELVFTGNNLQYGVYRLIYEVTVLFNQGVDKVNNTVDSYIRIIPSNFIVISIPGGLNRISIGTNQEFSLNPANYSYDLDDILSPSSMNFSFYCRVDNNGIILKNFSTDLFTFKSQNLPMNSNEDCFNSSGFCYSLNI